MGAVIDVARVAYGEPAVARLAAQIRDAKPGDALTPVAVIVPGNYVRARIESATASSAIEGVVGDARVEKVVIGSAWDPRIERRWRSPAPTCRCTQVPAGNCSTHPGTLDVPAAVRCRK